MLKLLVIATVLGLQGQEPKKYEIRLEPRAIVGAKHTSVFTDAGSNGMKLTVNGEVNKENADESAASSEAAVETLKVRGEEPAEERWIIQKAAVSKNKKDVALGFVGKALIVTYEADGKRKVTRADGTALSESDDENFWKCTGLSKEKNEGPTGKEMLAPKKPVAVGESWTPDIEAMAKSMAKSMKMPIDPKNFTAKLTLTAVETVGTVLFGRISFEMKITIAQLEGMTLEKPFEMKATADLYACIDGTGPDGTLETNFGLNGESALKLEEGAPPVVLALASIQKRTQKRTSVK